MVRPSGATTVRTGGCFVRVSPRCAGTTYTVRPSGMVTTRGCSLADCAATGPAAESSTPIFTEFRSEEHTSELQSLMRISYAVFCLKKKKKKTHTTTSTYTYQTPIIT